jgi:hypothetical protein
MLGIFFEVNNNKSIYKPKVMLYLCLRELPALVPDQVHSQSNQVTHLASSGQICSEAANYYSAVSTWVDKSRPWVDKGPTYNVPPPQQQLNSAQN